jgi:hypothetical protein
MLCQATQSEMEGKQGPDKSTLQQSLIAKHDSTECSLSHTEQKLVGLSHNDDHYQPGKLARSTPAVAEQPAKN